MGIQTVGRQGQKGKSLMEIMTLDNWLNLILLLFAISLIGYEYFKYYVPADSSEKLVMKILSVIGVVIWSADTILSRW